MRIANLQARRALVVTTLLTTALLASCLPVPLGDPEKSKVNPKLVGFWHSQNGEEGVVVAIAAADSHAYVVDSARYKREGGDPAVQSHLVLRAWATPVKGATFLTMEPVNQAANTKLPADKRGYPTYRIDASPDAVTARMLESKFDGFKELHDSAALAAVVERNVDEPRMYVERPETYRRLDPDDEQDKKLIDLLGR